MNKAELVEEIAKKAKMPKTQVDEVVKTLIEVIGKTVKKDPKGVQLIGLGTFKSVKRKARTGVNPMTGQKIKIAACKTLKFKASANLKKL